MSVIFKSIIKVVQFLLFPVGYNFYERKTILQRMIFIPLIEKRKHYEKNLLTL